MMMSKPAPAEEEETAPPAFASPPATTTTTTKTGTVEDLERRLAMLGDGEEANVTSKNEPPAVKEAPAASTAPSVEAPAPVKGGKNALLARIMAAKEKSQQAKVAPAPVKEAPPAAAAAPPPPADLLMDFDAPVSETDPPPSYNTNFLSTMAPPPPAVDAPPAFETVETNIMEQQFPPPPPIDSVMPPPPPMQDVVPPPSEPPVMMMMAPSAPAASAPAFEDLLDGTTTTQQTADGSHPPPLPPPPVEEQPPALDIDESILNALDPAEREAFLEEQRKIMEQIEKERSGNQPSSAAARAAAFDQRSSAAVAQVAASYEGGSSRSRSNKSSSSSSKRSTATSSGGGAMVNLGEGQEVPLHGQEKTQQAIKDGTAVIVQCMSCSNWMQVTEAAELMFCPICQVVCHVEKKGAAHDMEAAAQMAADAELAEKLQREEYQRAGGGRSGSSSRRRQAAAPAAAAASSGDNQSWYDWLVGAPAPAPAVSSSRSAEVRPRSGLVAAQTGEEGGSRSYDESEGLIRGGGGARVAEQKSMFACVADSISTAATQMTAYTLPEDQEGNVHGVDSSGLLAMPDVSRQREGSS
mmetsp:Transcript_13334/g.21492  ORF Transcript_13334/g.21492 Transcript_13334/m.21492 type:complete len:581 (-) Transcript_13334:148-1890(-)